MFCHSIVGEKGRDLIKVLPYTNKGGRGFCRLNQRTHTLLRGLAFWASFKGKVSSTYTLSIHIYESHQGQAKKNALLFVGLFMSVFGWNIEDGWCIAWPGGLESQIYDIVYLYLGTLIFTNLYIWKYIFIENIKNITSLQT